MPENPTPDAIPAEPVEDETTPPARPVFYRDPVYLLGAAAFIAGFMFWAVRRPRGGGQVVYLAKGPCKDCPGGAVRRVEPVDGQQFVDAASGEPVVFHDGHVGPVSEPEPSTIRPAGTLGQGSDEQPLAARTEPAAGPSAGGDDQNPVGAAVDPQALVVAEAADRGLDRAQV